MIISIFGPPGSGKGTQSYLLTNRENFIQLSTGDMLRSEVSNNTDLGMKVKKYLDSGKLVPDELIIDVVKARLDTLVASYSSLRLIFDGFPRTEKQCLMLADILTDMGLSMDRAFLLNIDLEDLVRRLVARRVCSSCGKVYNLVLSPPLKDNLCDNCGAVLIHRSDDQENIIRERIKTYSEFIDSIKSFFSNRTTIFDIDANQSIENVYRDIVSKLFIKK